MLLFIYLQTIINVCNSISLPEYHKSNCVQSLYTVLRKSTKIAFTAQDKREIYISHPNIPLLFKQNSPKLQGAVYCLIKNGWAEKVDFTHLQKGDIVQYWNNTSGHCGIYSHTKNNKIYLWSSFPVTNWSVSAFDKPKTLYACRIKQKYLK